MIKIDENDPVGEIEPSFPYREVKIKKNTDMKQFYDLQREIGRGKFGTVYRCRERTTGLKLAAKFINISKRQDRRNAEREVDIMKELQHPRLIQLYDAYEMNNIMCVVLELIEGGELFERVIDDDFVLTEKSVSVFMRQICEGVAFIHSKNILHLDLKPENILCLTRDGNRIKIIDFGLARKYDPEKKLQVLFGTPEFVAPEVVNFDSIGFGTDMWSVGVICYVLISGLSPFMGETDVQTMANVTIAQYDFDDEAFNDISKEAQDFISKLLRKNREERLSATECMSHRWLWQKKNVQTANDTVSTQTNNELDFQKDNLRSIADRWNSNSNVISVAPDSEDKNTLIRIANGIDEEKSKLPGKGKPTAADGKSKVVAKKAQTNSPKAKKSKKGSIKRKSVGKEEGEREPANSNCAEVAGKCDRKFDETKNIPDDESKTKCDKRLVEGTDDTKGNRKTPDQIKAESKILEESNKDDRTLKSSPPADSVSKIKQSKKLSREIEIADNRANIVPAKSETVNLSSKHSNPKWPENSVVKDQELKSQPNSLVPDKECGMKKTLETNGGVTFKQAEKVTEKPKTSDLPSQQNATVSNTTSAVENAKLRPETIDSENKTSTKILFEMKASQSVPVEQESDNSNTKLLNSESSKLQIQNKGNVHVLKISNDSKAKEIKNNANSDRISPKASPKVREEKQENSNCNYTKSDRISPKASPKLGKAKQENTICNSTKSTQVKAINGVVENGFEIDKTKKSKVFDINNTKTKTNHFERTSTQQKSHTVESKKKQTCTIEIQKSDDETSSSKAEATSAARPSKMLEVEVDDSSYRCIKKRNVFIKNIVESYEQKNQKVQKIVHQDKEADARATEAEDTLSKFAELLDRPQLTHRRVSDISSLLSRSDRLDKSMDEMTAFCNNINQIARLRSDSCPKAECESTSKRPKFRLSCFSRDVPTFTSTPPYRTNLLNYLPWCGGEENAFSWTLKKSTSHHSDPGSLRNSPDRPTSPSLTRKILSKFFDNANEYNIDDFSPTSRNLTKEKLTEIFS